MRVKDILIQAVLVVSLGANAWLANERLEKKFYQKGVSDGRSILAKQVIAQVEKTGKLSITNNKGKEIPLVIARPGLPGEIDAAKAKAEIRRQKYEAGEDLSVDGVTKP